MAKKYELRGTELYITLPGELDHETSDLLKEETDLILSAYNVKDIVFDFHNTGFMDSSGIGVIMSRYRALGSRKGCILAVNTDERIRKILRLSGMYKIVSIEDNNE